MGVRLRYAAQRNQNAALFAENLEILPRLDAAFLPDLLDRKYKNAAKEFAWQWFFPAQSMMSVPATQEYRRYHIHESVVQKALKQAKSPLDFDSV